MKAQVRIVAGAADCEGYAESTGEHFTTLHLIVLVLHAPNSTGFPKP